MKDPKTMTRDELLDAFRTSNDPEETKALQTEINGRIDKLGKARHPKECICIECTHTEEG